MKISVDDQECFSLTETQKKVMKNDIMEEIFEDDMKRRLKYILMHKYERCFERLKKEWDERLPTLGIKSIPTDKDEFAELIFQQAEYKNRSQRDANSLHLLENKIL